MLLNKVPAHEIQGKNIHKYKLHKHGTSDTIYNSINKKAGGVIPPGHTHVLEIDSTRSASAPWL